MVEYEMNKLIFSCWNDLIPDDFQLNSQYDDLYTVIRDAQEDGRLIVLKGPFKFPLEDDNKLIIRKADKHIFTWGKKLVSVDTQLKE